MSKLPTIKRYVERRSWLHPFLSFWRIHAMLLLALHAMLTFAFCTQRTGVVFDGALLEVSHTCMHACIHECIPRCIHALVHAYIGAYIHRCIHT